MWAKVFSAFIASFILIDFSVPSIILEYILICWNKMGCSFYICQFCAHWWKKEVIYGFCLKTNLTKEIIRKAFCFTCKNWKRCQIFDHLQVHLLYFCNCVWPFLCFLNFSKSLFLSFLDHLVIHFLKHISNYTKCNNYWLCISMMDKILDPLVWLSIYYSSIVKFPL